MSSDFAQCNIAVCRLQYWNNIAVCSLVQVSLLSIKSLRYYIKYFKQSKDRRGHSWEVQIWLSVQEKSARVYFQGPCLALGQIDSCGDQCVPERCGANLLRLLTKKRWRKAYPLCNVDSIHSSNVHSNQNHVHSSQTTHIPLKQWLLLNYTGCDQEL